MARVSSERPRALLVEDRPRALSNRVKLLRDAGFDAVGVTSSKEALRELNSGPNFDLVVTDINLDSARADDRSGLTFAKAVRKDRSRLPVVGYSARVANEEIPAEEMSIFDSYVSKGHDLPVRLVQQTGEWLKMATKYRRERIAFATAELARLREKYGISEQDFDALRGFLPGIHVLPPIQEELSPDELLRRVGYTLRLIQPNTRVDVEQIGASQTSIPLAVWLGHEGDCVVAELHGFSSIYATGKDEKDAIRQMLALMLGYYEDFKTDRPVSGEAASLQNYLRRVFG